MKRLPLRTFLPALALTGALITPAALASETRPGSVDKPAPAAGASKAPAKPAPTETPAVSPDEIGPGVWAASFDTMTAVWIDLGDGLCLIDTGGSPADAKILKQRIAATAKGKPLRWLVLTHLHGQVNSADGLPEFLAPETTVFLHSRVTDPFKKALATHDFVVPPVVAVSGSTTIKGTKRSLELTALANPAHSNHDLFAFLPDLRLAIVGDLVTPGRCPDLLDPYADLAGMLAALDLVQKASPLGIVGSTGGSADAGIEIETTRAYVRRTLKILFELKQEATPTAKIASHFRMNPLQGYCSPEIDARNAVALYERMGPDGRLAPGGAARSRSQNE